MTPSTAFCFARLRHYRTFYSPTPQHAYTPISTKLTYRNTESIRTLHTPTVSMFRRVAAAVPSQAGRVLSTVARPNIASPIRTAAPILASAGRRQYHEKDRFLFCAMRDSGELVAMDPITSDMLPMPRNSLSSALLECPANMHSTARSLQPPT
jgi:hypothetical protein